MVLPPTCCVNRDLTAAQPWWYLSVTIFKRHQWSQIRVETVRPSCLFEKLISACTLVVVAQIIQPALGIEPGSRRLPFRHSVCTVGIHHWATDTCEWNSSKIVSHRICSSIYESCWVLALRRPFSKHNCFNVQVMYNVLQESRHHWVN